MLNVTLGIISTKTLEVTRDLTIARVHPNLPAVFGTPMMIYLMEDTAAELLLPYLPEGWISVGTLVNVKHLAPTPVGAIVTARAKVIDSGENTVTFSVEAHDGIEKIGEGTHVRAAVEVSRFVRRVARKQENLRS